MELVLPSGEYQLVNHGVYRPDVGLAYQQYPNADRAGFEVQLPFSARGRGLVPVFVLTTESPGGLVEQIELAPGKRVPGKRASRLKKLVGVRLGQLPAGHESWEPSSVQIEAYLRNRIEDQPSLTLRLDVVNQCNLRCVMCQFSDEAIFSRPMDAMAPDEFRELFQVIAPAVRKVILSSAYEPMVSPHFREILQIVANEEGTRYVEFCTNATLLNSKMRRLLIETGVTNLLVSMDGCRRETVERIRVGARYSKLVGNLIALRDLKQASKTELPRVTLNYVMGQSNVEEAPAFVELSARAGASEIDFRHMWHYSAGQDDPEDLLSDNPGQYNFYRPLILAAAESAGLDVVLPEPFETDDEWSGEVFGNAVLLQDFEAVAPSPDQGAPPQPQIQHPEFDPKRSRTETVPEADTTYCSRPFTEVYLKEDGQVSPCHWHKNSLGKVGHDGSLAEIFFGAAYANLRYNMHRGVVDKGCVGCPLKSGRLGEELIQRAGMPDRGG